MINKSKLLYILSFMVAMFIGCEDNNDDPVADTTIPTPLTYEFESRFTEGESSVSYNGQVVRNLLINDIKGQFKGGNGTKVLSMMAKMTPVLRFLLPLVQLFSQHTMISQLVN